MRLENADEEGLFAFGELLKVFRKSKGISQQEIARKLDVHRNTLVKWERGDCLPESKTIVLELARQLQLDQHQTRQLLEASLTALAPYWHVPYQRNPFFTGRDEVLHQLHHALSHERSAVLSQSYALSGMGGIGKTQTAIEYAYRYVNKYTAVFWISAETSESILSSIVALAHVLNLSEKLEQEQSRVAAAVSRWLTSHREWLLILDNVEDIELVKGFLPSARSGSLLVTSRRQALGFTSHLLNLEPMTPEEGVQFLLHRARQLSMAIPGAAFPRETLPILPIVSDATALVKLLEGLPLALDQAGAYIEETGCSVAEYMQHFHHQRKQILAYRGTYPGSHPASVSTTLRLSVERIEREHPAAADLLRLCAFLHPEAIPEELLTRGAPHLGPVLGSVVADPYRFDLALAALRSASLVTRHPAVRTLSVHRLVQVVLQDQMERTDVCLWSERAVHMVNAAFPVVKFGTLAQCERYLAQALACVPLIERGGRAMPEAGELLYKAGSYLLERGRFGEAEPVLERAVALGEQLQGLDHPALLPLLEKQAELFWRQGKYEHCEPLLQRVLALGKHHLGPDHLQVAETLNNLALLYWNQGRYKEAEPLYQQALILKERHLGADHLQVAETLGNLALLYGSQGRYEEAEALHQQVLALYEEQLDPEHPQIARALNSLAVLYDEQEKYEQAEPLFQRALCIWEHQLGSEHPQAALALNNLAFLYRAQGKYRESESLYLRALILREQQLGSDHPLTGGTLNGLGTLYREQGQYEQAEPLYQRALLICEQRLGPEHPQTAETLHHLAMLYREQGQYEQAEPLYAQALAICERALGEGHPRTQAVRTNYASLLHLMGREL